MEQEAKRVGAHMNRDYKRGQSPLLVIEWERGVGHLVEREARLQQTPVFGGRRGMGLALS